MIKTQFRVVWLQDIIRNDHQQVRSLRLVHLGAHNNKGGREERKFKVENKNRMKICTEISMRRIALKDKNNPFYQQLV